VLRAVLALVLTAATLVLVPAPATARALKLWPLVEYETDPAAGTLSVRLLGPLVEYRSDPDSLRLAVRPFFSIRQARAGHDDEVRVFYPLLTSRWQTREQVTTGLAGLVTYRTTTADGKTLTSQRLRAFPFYFYDWEPARGSTASVVPVYADLEDFFGFERVQMVLFPGYLRLRQPLVDRRYLFFPLLGDVGGTLGSGFRVWPFYGRKTLGATYDSGFVLWPFYIWDARTAGGETEHRLISFPLYSRVSGPERESTAYGTLLYTHTVNHAAQEESWGFPWPLWVYQKSTATETPETLRLFPFYQRRHQGDLDARFVLWPLYRTRSFSDDEFRYERSDGLLVLYRDEVRAHRPSDTSARLRTLFPAYRSERIDDRSEGGAPAVLDALFPRNAAIRELYAPLWQMYTWDGPVEEPRWSVAWGAFTHANDVTTYPWRWNLDAP
jgi:hypothetical protein